MIKMKYKCTEHSDVWLDVDPDDDGSRITISNGPTQISICLSEKDLKKLERNIRSILRGDIYHKRFAGV